MTREGREIMETLRVGDVTPEDDAFETVTDAIEDIFAGGFFAVEPDTQQIHRAAGQHEDFPIPAGSGLDHRIETAIAGKNDQTRYVSVFEFTGGRKIIGWKFNPSFFAKTVSGQRLI